MMINPIWLILIVLLIALSTLFILLAIVQSGVERAGPPPQIVEGAILPILFLFPSQLLKILKDVHIFGTSKGERLSKEVGSKGNSKGQGVIWLIVTVIMVIALIAIILALLGAFSEPGPGTEVSIIERIADIFA